MTYYIYAKPCKNSYVSEVILDGNPLFQGYEYIGESETYPDVASKKYIDGQWVSNELPEYISKRANEYPHLGDQLDMFWHAMKDGTIPKIEPFYSKIEEIKLKYPKG